MPLPPLRLDEVRQDAVINAPATMPNNPPAPAGVGDTGSTLSAPAQSEGCCGWIGERFSALGNKLQDLFLSFRDWLKSWFVPPQADNNVNPVDGDQVNNPEPNPPVNNPQPTPELILQTFGDEVRYLLPMISAIFEALRDPVPAGIEPPHGDIGAYLIGVFDTFPEMVQLNIQNRMEELKREANPGVALVDNWAHRVIRGEVQYPGEAAPIATAEERNILDENHVFNRAIAELLMRLGGEPNPEELPRTLRIMKGMIHIANFLLFMHQNQPQPELRARNMRNGIVNPFTELPPEVQNQVKTRMVEIADPESPEVRQIPDWANRVIQGEVRVPGEAANRASIERHLDILDPGSLFSQAISDVINAAPIPQPAHA